jgi:hypothetical protein
MISIFTALAMLPGVASAADGIGSTSSGSITIRVEVPPLAAALQAQVDGAVGVDSVVDTKSAIMIRLPSTLSGSESATAALYYGSDMPVTLTPAQSANMTLTPAKAERLNGMIRQSFSFSSTSATQDFADQSAGMTFIVTPV